MLFAALIVQLGVTMLAWDLVSPLLQALLSRRRGSAVGRAGISWVFRSFIASAQALGMMRVDSGALDALCDEPGGLIVAANHPSMLDAVILTARLPRGVCVMKAELMRNVFLGAGARLARYICNDSPRALIRDAAATLREGGQLVLFPEGTRTVSGPIDPFRPGITRIAQLAQVPIQTVIIETDSPYLRKGWPLLRVPPVPIVVRARLGERFMPDADHRATLARLEAYFAAELRS
nr:lysophospholipid acyltransferase family protein [Schlegelella koreensis]